MRRAAGAALERDSNSAEAHGLMALVNTHYDWDWQGAERHFARALALSPSDAQVHHDYAHFLLALGREAESVAETKRARELDPANPMLTSCVGWHSLFDDQFDQAAKFATEAQRMMPSFWAQTVLGWAYLGKGENDSAVVALRKAVSLSGDLPFARAALAHALAKAGKTREARELLAGLLQQSLRGYVSAYDVAVVYAGLGDNDRAIEWLRKAIGERSIFVVHLAWDSRLDGLRGDPRFAALVSQLGIPPGHRRAPTPTA
jgi:Tfp pilus assembly protein PilF